MIGQCQTTINSSAFENCTGITSIAGFNGVTQMGENAFRGCTSLAS
ncbi:MAG: leucine-rich repeat protein, partial [Clostridia bacterium]|nr:leucine-rich repeat protein [Clostridia bacterium]